MTPEQRRSVKVMVKGKTHLSYVQSANVVRLMEVKNDIDNSRFQSALYGLLEFVLRQADLGPVGTLDDLTKLLNTIVHVRLDTGSSTIRELIKEGDVK